MDLSFWSYRKPNSVLVMQAWLVTTIYLAPKLLSESSGSSLDSSSQNRYRFCDSSLGTRPCTEVRVLPLHSCVTASITPLRFAKQSFAGWLLLSLQPSLFAPLVVNLTGITRYLFPSTYLLAQVRSGRCSDFPPLSHLLQQDWSGCLVQLVVL